MPVDPPDRIVVRLAARQHGIVTTEQLRACGIGRHAIAHRVTCGWLRRMYRGVYLVGPLQAPSSASMAAVLAYGAGALLSHHPAAVLWGLRPPPAQTMHVTVATRDARSRRGITAHHVATLHPSDATRRHGIPVTSPARTLLDLATQLTPRDLTRAVEEARIHRLATDVSLTEQLERYPTHRGAAALKRAIPSEPALTRSEAERRLLELVRAARLPQPEANVRVGRHEVDLLWRTEELVVEVDGYAFHSSRAAFERDRRRDAELAAAGIRVIRVTWRQIVEEPEAVVARLAAALVAQARPLRRSRSSAVSA